MPAGDPKHRAKRFNEGAKLVATLFNSLAIITLGTAFIGPIVQGRFDVLPKGGWVLLLVALSLRFIAPLAVRLIRAEE